MLAYLRACLEELRHVTWPTRRQAVRLSTIVIAFTLGSAAVFGIIDWLMGILTIQMLSLA